MPEIARRTSSEYFYSGNVKSIQLLRNMFNLFPEAFGLKVNLNKTLVYCGGVDENTKREILNIL